MKRAVFLLVLLGACRLQAQVVDRYPYIQQPTETGVLVAWNTAVSATGTLHWGTTPTALVQSVSDAAPTQKHALAIAGLQPHTQYFYRVTTDAGDSSAVEHFWTAKPIEERAVTFLHYADCGYDNTVQNQLAALMEGEAVDFAVVAGDVDQGVGDAYDEVFFGPYRDMLARDCHYTAIGNHDIIANGGVDFFDAFHQPTNNLQQSEHYYSFTWGNAKFICLDSNGDYSIGSDQHDFLLEELRCRDQEWLFVFFHHPPWTNAWDASYYVPFQPYYQYDGNDDMRTALVPFFEQYGVDYVLNGHSHCYQRGEMNGIHYVISGGAGASTLDQHTCNTFPNFATCSPNIQQELYVNEYVRFRIHGDTVTYAAVDPTGQVVDSVHHVKAWTPYAADFSVDPASDVGAADGSATVNVVGPRPPYSYLWSNGATTATAGGLAAGTYTVTVTDALGCARTETVAVGVSVGAQAPSLGITGISPNPFTHQCRITFQNPGRQPFEMEVVDAQGRVVMRRDGLRGSVATIERGDLGAGIYLVRLHHQGTAYTGKVIVR